MAKIRVYELARDLGIESKLLVNTLKSIGVTVASHQSSIDTNDVDKVKRAMKGEAVAPAAAAAATAAKPAAVKVIRRRRRGAEPAAEEPPAEATASVESEAGEASASAESVSAESAPPAAAEPEKAIAEAPAQPSEPEAGEAQAEASGESEEAPEEPPKRRVPAGARILRKATPEEVVASRAQREQQQTRRRTKKEDSQGTKYTGIGAGGRDSSRGQSGAGASAMPAPADSGKTPPRRLGAKDKDRRKDHDEEELAKKPVAAKSKRDGPVRTRQLLSQIDSFEGDDEGEAEVAPTAAPSKTVYTPSASNRRRDLKRRKDLKKTEITVARAAYRVVQMGDEITVGELAKQLKVKAGEVIKKLMSQGVMATVNQSIDFDTVSLIASEYNHEVKSTVKSLDEVMGATEEAKKDVPLEPRAPIVTVMGHVDHGKTSILDAIRKTDVVAGEAGGITQHIGAYSVMHKDKRIAFLDTPGHEAFSSMRARGATVTDIVVLVVAADDGVMPQTVEAISHAKDANVPLIVAVNKMDKENLNLDRIYTELTEHGVQAEEWGGETQFVKVSALQRTGIDELLEAVQLQAEMLELKAPVDCPAEGTVVEAHLDTGRGAVATIMVREGILESGQYIVAGQEFGRVRAMHDHKGKLQKQAGPATPVEILGLSGVPLAGDAVNVVDSERRAREVLDWRREQMRTGAKSSAQSLEDLLGKMQTSETPELPVVIKGDTQGSVEAIVEALNKLNTDSVRNKVIHKAVGGISESDISLSEASGGVILGFNVRASRGLDDAAEKRGVLVQYFSVIYDLIDAVKNLMAGKLPPIEEEVTQGRAEVRQSISVPKIGVIAGSAVTDGMIKRNSNLRLIRDDIVIYNGKISSLRRFKDDVREVKSGYECGIGIENYNDIKIGDIIEAYEIIETRPSL